MKFIHSCHSLSDEYTTIVGVGGGSRVNFCWYVSLASQNSYPIMV